MLVRKEQVRKSLGVARNCGILDHVLTRLHQPTAPPTAGVAEVTLCREEDEWLGGEGLSEVVGA